MNIFDTSKVQTEYRDGIGETAPILGRKYTMTHSDETAMLFVTIGRSYAEDKVEMLRDEVRLAFTNCNRRLQLMGTVLIDKFGKEWNSKLRNEIFMREMPLALKAIRYADSCLYENRPCLDEIPIFIWFQSDSAEYNKVYNFGAMKEYR